MEVIGCLSSVLQIIDSVTRVAKRLNEVRESYNKVALNTTLVASQLSTIRAALEALYEWRASDRDASGPSRQLDKDLGMSLSCCAILISVINGKLDDSGYMPGLKQKIKYLWLEDILKEYISNLEGQIRALQLLLTIFQCRTETEKRQKLGNEESRTIMEQVRAETASLALDARDFQDAASVWSLDPSVTLDIDSILMKSPAYKRVYGNARPPLPPAVNAIPMENSEQAIQPGSAPFPDQTLQAPPLPSRPARKPMPQSRARINVWDYYPGEQDGDHMANETIMADSRDVFELPGETQESVTASRRDQGSKEEQDSLLQLENPVTERADGEEEKTNTESTMGRLIEDKPLSTHTEKTLSAPVDDTEHVSALEGLMNQLEFAFAEKSLSRDGERDFGLLYGNVLPLEPEESHTAAIPKIEALQTLSRKGSKERGRSSKSRSGDLDLDLNRRKSLSEEDQRPMSTHSSLYECSIVSVPKDQSTRTSSPYSCVSCRNVGAVDPALEIDRLEAEKHEPVHSKLQPEFGNADVQEGANDKDLNAKRLDESQKTPIDARSSLSQGSQPQPPNEILPLLAKSTTAEEDTDPTTLFTAPVDDLTKSSFEDLEHFEASQSNAGLGIQHIKTPVTSDLQPQEIEDSCSGMLSPPRFVLPTSRSSSQIPPAVVFFPSAESTSTESEQSGLSSNKPSSAHDATSTISSSETPEDSTILSLQQSTSNTAATTVATTVDTHPPASDGYQSHSDLRRLQNELATAKVKGDSGAVQDSLQRSIEVIRGKYLAKPPAEDNNAPTKAPSPRFGKARSNIMRFPSLPGSTKGVALGDCAASGNTLSVQNILKEKVNIDSRSDNFKTPLMRAAMNGHIECMKLLMQSGADELAVDAKGRTALHIAVASNRLAVVRWLLETYPPPKPDPLRQRPSILFRATDVVKGVRIQKNLREASDAEGSKPLHIAAETDQGGMLKTLVAAGVDIDSKDNWGRTPFHRAIISKRRDSFNTLFQNGAKIGAVDAKSVSSLHLAAQSGQVDMIGILLANGAERWDFDADGNQPIHSAVQAGNPFAIEALVTERTDLAKRTKSGETLLHLACLKKDLEVAKYLLMNLVDANPWAPPSSDVLQVLSHTRLKGSSMTPLHYACCTRDFEMAILLLDHEALVNAPTPEGATALMMAVENEDTNLVNLLLQREAKVNAKVPGSLITALHLAARRGDLETVQQLCRHRADDSARASGSTYRRTPFDECAKCPDKKKGQAVERYISTVVRNRMNNTLRAKARHHQASHPGPEQRYFNPPGAENAQYYHPDFDVQDDILPVYQPGPSAPARSANQAPVRREKYA